MKDTTFHKQDKEAMKNVIEINEQGVRNHLDEMVRTTVEDTLRGGP